MTLDDLKCQIEVLWISFGDFRLRDTFQKWTAPKPIEIDMEKLHMKFSALKVDFDGPSPDFLGSRKPAQEEGIKKWYPVKVVNLLLLTSLS